MSNSAHENNTTEQLFQNLGVVEEVRSTKGEGRKKPLFIFPSLRAKRGNPHHGEIASSSGTPRNDELTKYKRYVREHNWRRHRIKKFAVPILRVNHSLTHNKSKITSPFSPLTSHFKGWPRRIAVTCLAIFITATGFLIYNKVVQADWYATTWLYRKQITINHTKVPSTQSNFPVLVSVTDTSLAANAQSSGADILFTSSNGTTKLSHEIESYDSNTGKLVAWVEVPSVSATADTPIYMYYGNSSASDQQDGDNVWDTNFKGVWHLKQNPAVAGSGGILDSTSNNNDGTDNGSMDAADQVAGQINGSFDFEGTDDYVGVPHHSSLAPTNVTASTWVYFDALDGGFQGIFSKGESGGWDMTEDETDGMVIFGAYVGGAWHTADVAVSTLSTGTWYHLVGTYDGDTVRFYINGVERATNTTPSGNITYSVSNSVIIGAEADTATTPQAGTYFDGRMDESRVSNSARSADWIKTEYNNQSNPAAFLTVGNQQQKKNPVLLWKFDEGSGLTAGDASGKNNFGTISGATWQNKDVCLFEGSCLKFDGSNDYVRRLHDGSADAWCNDTNGLRGCTASWSARMKITFAGNEATENLTDFPVLVKLDSTRIDYSKMQADGRDIRFVDAAAPNTVLPHEIESWNNGGTSYVWVKVPQIAANSRTDYIMMYYGSSAPPDAQNTPNVWETNYRNVYHMKGTNGSATIPDSATGNSTENGAKESGASAGSPANTASGKIADAQDFVQPDYVQVSGTVGSPANVTLEAWIDLDVFDSGGAEVVSIADAVAIRTGATQLTGFYHRGSGVWNSTQATISSLAGAGWHHLSYTMDDTSNIQKVYMDGVLLATSSDTESISYAGVGTNTQIGREGNGGTTLDFDGRIDEVRISSTARSTDWVKASYLNQADQFNTYAAEGSNAKLEPGTGSFSVAAWFRHPLSASGTDTIIARTDAVAGVGYKLYYDATNTQLCFGIDGTAGSFPSDSACSNTTYADNKWHYVEAVKNGTSNIRLYVDGVQVGTDDSITSSSLNGVSAPFYVGIDTDGSTNPWDGYIDEVKVYDYARSDAEVKADYNAKGAVLGAATSLGGVDAKSALSNGLVGYWKLDDGVSNACPSGVNKACDSSGNGNVGTWNNSTASTSGKFGYATVYDGTNDVTEVADPASGVLDFGATESFTVSQWVYPTSETGGSDHSLYKGASSSTDDGYNFELGNGQWLAAISDGSTRVTSQLTADGPVNEWVHIMFVVDRASKQMKTYMNGQLTNATDISSFGAVLSPRALRFGANFVDSNDYAGRIDDTRIYNRALSPREVTTLYDWSPGPVGYYKFDEKNGTSAVDSSGNGNTGTVGGNAKWAGGKVGGAMQFKGIGNGGYVSLPVSGVLGSVTDASHTYSAWVYPDSVPPTTGDGEQDGGVIIRKGWHSGIRYTQGQDFYAELRENTTTTSVADSTVLAPQQWYYVTQVVDDTAKTVKLYINGVEIESNSYTTLFEYGTNELTIGNDGSGGACSDNWTWCFDGRVDDMKIYNYARSAKQVVSDMNGGHPAVGSPVGSAQLYYKFDEGFGNVASNSGSIGNTSKGEIYNMASPATNASGWTNEGRFGKALTFDNNNDFVQITNPSLPTTDFTYSVWANFVTTSGNSLIMASNGSGGNEFSVSINSGRIDVRLNGATARTLPASASITAMKWNHYVFTRSGSTVTAYLNGKQIDSWTDATVLNFGSCPLMVGADVDDGCTGGLGNNLDGKVDELKVYNYALNANEVKVEYNRGQGIVLGSLSTNPDNKTASNSAARAYCPPGNAETNCAGTGGLNPAPIGEWKLDERKGTIASDTSGNGFNGVLTNGPMWSSGKVGAGLNFDGSNDFIGIANSTILQPNNISVEAWINPTQTFDDFYGAIASKANGNGWGLAMDRGSGVILFEVFVGGAWRTASYSYGNNLPFNLWSHVAGTYDGTNVLLYLNGVQVGSTTTSGNITYGSSNSVIIGADAAAGTTPDDDTYFSGKIDDVRIYNYNRTQAQVAWDYNKGKPLRYYKFDECTGSTFYDTAASGSGRLTGINGYWNGSASGNTSAGTCTSGSSTEARYNGRIGKFNSSLDFDGTNDYVNVVGPGLPTGDFTYSTWVNLDSVTDEAILMSPNSGGGNEFFLSVGSSTDAGRVRVTVNDTDFYSSNLIAASIWNHIAVTRSGGTIRLYINGKQQNESFTESSTLNFTGCDLYFGVDFDTSCTGSPGNYADGRIDEVMIFNYALSPAQIKVVYNQNSAVRFGPQTGMPQ